MNESPSQRQRRRVEEAVRKGKHSGANQRSFAGDWKHLSNSIFSESAREFLDLVLGPITVFPVKEEGNLVHRWQHFPISFVKNHVAKARIARHLLMAKDDRGLLLPRGSHVLLSVGSTVFFLALELARLLRKSIEEANDDVFTAYGGSFFGDWQTESFEIARLLGPLCVRDSAPPFYLCGHLVSRKGQPQKFERLNICMFHDAAQRHSSPNVLITGCSNVDADGSIFTEHGGDQKQMERYLTLLQPRGLVLIVATHDKLGSPGDSVFRVNTDRTDLRYCAITDNQPSKALTGVQVFVCPAQ